MSQSSSQSSSSSGKTEDAMGEYESAMTMQAAPQDVFDFVADIGNMPKYMPTTKSAQSQGEDRVRVQGEANHHAYDSDGYLRRNADNTRLDWGADEGYYSGWMQVEPQGSGSKVTVHISLRGKPPGASDGDAPPPGQIQEGLDKALQSIQNYVEGKGGKEESSAETS